MHTLIIALISISLEALCLFALLSATPRWMATAPDVARVIAAGISETDNAFNRYVAANGGPPAPTAATDGGLSSIFKPLYTAFAPPTIPGFAWKYGRDPGPSGMYYVCLYQASPSSTEDIYRGMTRLQTFLPYTAYTVDTTTGGCNTSPAGAADPATVSTNYVPPGSYPAKLAITFYLKSVPGQKPTSAVLPCTETGCVASPFL